MLEGNRRKDGVVISTDEHFDYYNPLNRTPLNKTVGGKEVRVQTLKTDYPVKVANKLLTVTVYPNGELKVEPNKV